VDEEAGGGVEEVVRGSITSSPYLYASERRSHGTDGPQGMIERSQGPWNENKFIDLNKETLHAKAVRVPWPAHVTQ
jgi:hypothetical protein